MSTSSTTPRAPQQYNNVASARVAPGIGLGRVGNAAPLDSADRSYFYFGPETPYEKPGQAQGNDTLRYKDDQGRILRQAQRFRVYVYDAQGACLGEVCDGDTVNGDVISLAWKTHLVNMKAANYAFQGQYAFTPDDYRNKDFDNPAVGTKPQDRRDLIIDPGEIGIQGVNQGPAELLAPSGTGSQIFASAPAGATLPHNLEYDPPQQSQSPIPVTYSSATVSLGVIYTDESGRLVVVGAEGRAESCTEPKVVITKGEGVPSTQIKAGGLENANPETNINSYFNNPGWFDDTAGGSINATLVAKSGGAKILQATRGWISVAPPKYAPTAYNIVSLLDLQLDLFPEADPYTGAGPVIFANSSAQALSLSSHPGSVSKTSASSGLPSSARIDAVTTYNGAIWTAAVDTTPPHQLYLGSVTVAQATQGEPTPFSLVPNVATQEVSLCAFQGRLFCAYLDDSGQVYLGSRTAANEDFGFTAVGTAIALHLGLCAYNGALYLALLTKSQLQLGASSDGSASSFEFCSTGGQTFSGAYRPSLTTFMSRLYIALVDASGSPQLGVWQGPPKPPGAPPNTELPKYEFQPVAVMKASSGAALTSFNNRLYYAIEVDGQTNIASVGSLKDGVIPTLTFAKTELATGNLPLLTTYEPVNFHRDILPFFEIASDYAWTSFQAFPAHRPGQPGDLVLPSFVAKAQEPTFGDKGAYLQARNRVFRALRPAAEVVEVPDPPSPVVGQVAASQEQVSALMPRLTGNGGSLAENSLFSPTFPNQWLSLTDQQLSKFQRWINGDFVTGTPGVKRWTDLPPDRAADFAALQPTVGGGFHPGIELTYLMQQAAFFDGPFSFKGDTVPGSIAGYMSIPWHGDFWSCNTTFWPAARPDIRVISKEGELDREAWFRGTTIPPTADQIDSYQGGYSKMVDLWDKLGFIVPNEGTNEGEAVFVEAERSPTLDAPTILKQHGESNAVQTGSAGLTLSALTGQANQLWQLSGEPTDPGQVVLALASDPTQVATAGDVGVKLEPKSIYKPPTQQWFFRPCGAAGSFTLESVSTPGKFLARGPSGALSLGTPGVVFELAPAKSFSITVDAQQQVLDLVQGKIVGQLDPVTDAVAKMSYQVSLQTDVHYRGSDLPMRKAVVYNTTDDQPDGWFYVVEEGHPIEITIGAEGGIGNSSVYAFLVDITSGDNTGSATLEFTPTGFGREQSTPIVAPPSTTPADFTMTVDPKQQVLDVSTGKLVGTLNPYTQATPGKRYRVTLETSVKYSNANLPMSKVLIYNTSDEQPEGWFYVVEAGQPIEVTIGATGYLNTSVYALLVDISPQDNTGTATLSFTAIP